MKNKLVSGGSSTKGNGSAGKTGSNANTKVTESDSKTANVGGGIGGTKGTGSAG